MYDNEMFRVLGATLTLTAAEFEHRVKIKLSDLHQMFLPQA